MPNTNSTLTDIEGIYIDVKFKPVRTLRLVIHRDGTPAITIPVGMTEEKVRQFIKKHHTWIVTKQAETRRRYQKEKNEIAHQYTEGEIFYFLGQEYKLQFVTQNSPSHIIHDTEHIYVCSRTPLNPTKTSQLIRAWYLQQLKEIIQSLVTHWLKQMNEAPISEIRLKDMTSQWGSCAPVRRILCFNTRLVYKPITCIEEVIVHELCHLKEASHNQNFHALMRHYLPDYKLRNRLLNKGV